MSRSGQGLVLFVRHEVAARRMIGHREWQEFNRRGERSQRVRPCLSYRGFFTSRWTGNVAGSHPREDNHRGLKLVPCSSTYGKVSHRLTIRRQVPRRRGFDYFIEGVAKTFHLSNRGLLIKCHVSNILIKTSRKWVKRCERNTKSTNPWRVEHED